MSTRALFSSATSSLQRSNSFLNAVQGRLRSNGQFALDPGEPIESPYVYRDEATNELVKLWRTRDDVFRQLKYKRYRKVVKLGLASIMLEEQPELFAPDERSKRPQNVRAYNMPALISAALTALTCGGGVTVQTGIDMVDSILDEFNLSERIPKWVYQASVYDFVGVKTTVDPIRQTVEVDKVWPDYIYIARDPHNTDEIKYISQKTWMPLERIPGWTPVAVDPAMARGGSALDGNIKRNRTGNVTSSQNNELAQDGFVLEERHFRGWVEYHFWAVAGDRILKSVDLAVYDKELADSPVRFTGMRDFAITIFPNVNLGDDRPTSDWDELLDPSIDFSRRATLNSRSVDRYSNPKAVVPASHIQIDPITGATRWGMGDGDVIITRPSDAMKPEYLQPNADFDAPREDLAHALSMLGTLSQMRYAIDPDVLDGVSSGVELKLKMAPAMGKVGPRRAAQVNAIRTIVYNVLSGVEFVSSRPVPDNVDARKKAYLGVLHWKGPVADAIENIADDLKKEGKLMRDINTGGSQKVSIRRLRPVFANLDTTSADEAAERTIRAARASFLVDQGRGENAQIAEARGFFDGTRQIRDPMKPLPNIVTESQDEAQFDSEGLENIEPAIAPFDPDAVFEGEDGQPMLPGSQIGRNVIMPHAAPQVIPIEVLQQQADALYVVENAITKDSLQIRLSPGLPQDHAEAATRVGGGTMSMFRLLTEFDGMTDEEAEAELQRIDDEQANTLDVQEFDTTQPFGDDGLGGKPPETQAAREALLAYKPNSMGSVQQLDESGMMEQLNPHPIPPGAHNQNDIVGQSLQQRGGEA